MLIHLFSPDPRYFNPRSSCEERRPGHPLRAFRCNFNPRSSCEERQDVENTEFHFSDFNPRSSCEERHMHRFVR